jgi:membrane protein implicated in regulation of membrane protease activity
MTDVLMWLSRSNWPYMETLFILSVVLVLIDYFFPVDFPAFLGYLCFAGGAFFAMPLPAVPSLLLALSVWVILLLLHVVWFSRYLTNAPNVSNAPGTRKAKSP